MNNATLVPVYLLQSDLTGGKITVLPMSNDAQDPLRLPGPVYAPTPAPTHHPHAFKDAVLVLLLMAAAGIGGYFTRAWESWKQQASMSEGNMTEGTLSLPPETKLIVNEPQEIRAETRGRRVIWMSLDRELVLRPYSAKSVWAWASAPGEYRVIAWSAVDGLPTPNAVAIVKVSDPAAEKTKTAKKDQP